MERSERRVTRSPEADDDLISIWLHGAGEWSPGQADRHLLEIELICHRLLNDPWLGKPRDDLIAGMKQMIERAHDKGIKVFGATITPFEGTTFPGYFSAEKEVKRKAVNEWIRNGKAFDGVIDFEKALRDPQNPAHILSAYDGGDRLHPSDAGYKAMGESIDLSLFR